MQLCSLSAQYTHIHVCADVSLREFYCHSIGHYLGMDVHDTNTIGPHRTLEPGVVMAVEPGLYIQTTRSSRPLPVSACGLRMTCSSQSGAQVRGPLGGSAAGCWWSTRLL